MCLSFTQLDHLISFAAETTIFYTRGSIILSAVAACDRYLHQSGSCDLELDRKIQTALAVKVAAMGLMKPEDTGITKQKPHGDIF